MMIRRRWIPLGLLPGVVAIGLLVAPARGSAADAGTPPKVAEALKAITSVSKEGAGNEAAAAGWKVVVSAGGEALIPTLTAFDNASPTAANWLRSAVDAIAEKETKAGKKLPGIWEFVKDTKRSPEARRIAFELARAEDKAAAEKMLPEMIEDPNLEIRKEAIAAKLADVQAKVKEMPARKQALLGLFEVTRDKDQAEAIAKLLTELGAKPDISRHFGYITEWQIIGPFDSPSGSGFSAELPPQKGIDLKGKYPGKGDATVAWKYTQSPDTYGKVDLNTEIGKHMDCAGFAFAVIDSPKEMPVEIRAASANAVQIFLNGKKLFEREEYHHGSVMDQHVGRGTLQKGKNEILVKIVQNNQKERWAQSWDFSVRVCDKFGGNLPVKQLISRNGGAEESVELGAIRISSSEKKEEK